MAARENFLNRLAQGVSPDEICSRHAIDPEEVARAYRNEEEFRRQWNRTEDLLGRNVVAALYQSAINGSVTAQAFWLKLRPPSGWGEEIEAFFCAELKSLMELSDEQLIELARSLGSAPWNPVAERTPTSSDELRSRRLSGFTDD